MRELLILWEAPKDFPKVEIWSRRAIARYLHMQPSTVRTYAEIATHVEEYQKEGIAGRLSRYQFWVICKIAALAKLLRKDINGCNYLPEVLKTVKSNQDCLSRVVYLKEVKGG